MKEPKQQEWETVPCTDNLDLPDYADIEVIEGFLPLPEMLIKRPPEAKKVTMVLETETIQFFQQKADELGVSYQRMSRNLLNEYASLYGGKERQTIK